MPYYVCNEHSIAFPTYKQFIGHWNMAHEGKPRPAKEEVEVEELPEGVTPNERKQRKSRGQGQPPQGEETETPPKDFRQLGEEPPEGIMERAKLFLNLHNIPEKLSTYCLNLLRAYPQAQGDPNVFANLLQSALLTSPAGKQHQSKLGMIVSGVFGLGQGGDTGGMPTPFFGGGQQSLAPSAPAWVQSTPLGLSDDSFNLFKFLESRGLYRSCRQSCTGAVRRTALQGCQEAVAGLYRGYAGIVLKLCRGHTETIQRSQRVIQRPCREGHATSTMHASDQHVPPGDHHQQETTTGSMQPPPCNQHACKGGYATSTMHASDQHVPPGDHHPAGDDHR